MDIKWVPGGGPSAIQAQWYTNLVTEAYFWAMFTYCCFWIPFLWLKDYSWYFLVKSIVLNHYFNWDKLRKHAITGKRKQSCKSVFSQIITLELILQHRFQGGSGGTHQTQALPGQDFSRWWPFCLATAKCWHWSCSRFTLALVIREESGPAGKGRAVQPLAESWCLWTNLAYTLSLLDSQLETESRHSWSPLCNWEAQRQASFLLSSSGCWWVSFSSFRWWATAHVKKQSWSYT